jgi:hypothetical protein
VIICPDTREPALDEALKAVPEAGWSCKKSFAVKLNQFIKRCKRASENTWWKISVKDELLNE